MKKILTILLLTIAITSQICWVVPSVLAETPDGSDLGGTFEAPAEEDWVDDPTDGDEFVDDMLEEAADVDNSDLSDPFGTGEDDEIDTALDELTEETNAELDAEELGESGESTEDEKSATEMPSIPKPDFLPGPDEGSSKSDILTYFREKAVPSFVGGFIGIVGLVAFVAMIVSGIQFLTSYGNEERASAAKRTATFAIVGFLIAILAYAIVSIISSLQLGTSSIEDISKSFSIEKAYAAEETAGEATEAEEEGLTVENLLPDEEVLIEGSSNSQGASLPSGDLAGDIIPQLVNIMLYLASTFVLAALAYSGILFVIARGNEEEVNKSRDILIYAVTGIIIIAISYAVIYGIASLNLG